MIFNYHQQIVQHKFLIIILHRRNFLENVEVAKFPKMTDRERGLYLNN